MKIVIFDVEDRDELPREFQRGFVEVVILVFVNCNVVIEEVD